MLKKLKPVDLISIKGGRVPCETFNMTAVSGQTHPRNDGTSDDSTWAC